MQQVVDMSQSIEIDTIKPMIEAFAEIDINHIQLRHGQARSIWLPSPPTNIVRRYDNRVTISPLASR